MPKALLITPNLNNGEYHNVDGLGNNLIQEYVIRGIMAKGDIITLACDQVRGLPKVDARKEAQLKYLIH